MTEPGPELSVRPMRLSDLPEVMETDRRSLPKPWSEEIWREELCSPFGLYKVLEESGALSGHVGLKLIFDEAHVMTLAVRPKRRRRGFAQALVEAALADPASAGVGRVYLEVRRATWRPVRSTALWASPRLVSVPATMATRTRFS